MVLVTATTTTVVVVHGMIQRVVVVVVVVVWFQRTVTSFFASEKLRGRRFLSGPRTPCVVPSASASTFTRHNAVKDVVDVHL